MEKEIKHISGSAGGFLVGRSHANNGIKAINKSTGLPLEMEGGEVVITKPAVEDDELREFEGEMLTNRQILSKINESGGGVSFALGGDIPTELYFTGNSYKYGGDTLTDYEIAHKISSCGCKHQNDGLSEGKTIEDIAAMHNVLVSHIENQIEKGVQVEAEHTSNVQEQTKIAMDHLVENPNYYDILAEAHLDKGGEIQKLSKNQKQEIIDSQNKFWESNDIYKLSSNGLNVLRKDNTQNPPKYKKYQSFEDFYLEILHREVAKTERENAKKVFDYLEQNGAELFHKSVYGSRYYYYKGNKIRVSNHWQTSEIKDAETGLNKYADLPSFYSDKPDGYKEMIAKIENLSNDNYAHGGNLKKGAENDDLDNITQVSDEVLDGPDILASEGGYFEKGGFLPTDIPQKLRSDIAFLVDLQDKKQNNRPSGGWDINLFKSSFFNKVKKLPNDQAIVVLDFLTALEETVGVKPIFSKNHKIWENYSTQKEVSNNTQSKYQVGDFVKYETGDLESERWVGEIKEVKNYGNEIAYKIDAYTRGVEAAPMFDAANNNEVYETQLKPTNDLVFNEAKKHYNRVMEKNQAEQNKKYDLGASFAGGVTVVWDRNQTKNGDYKTIAHIPSIGNVKYFEENLPQYVIDYVEGMKKNNISREPQTQTNYQISNYKNPYEVNRAIEQIIDSKESGFTPNEIEFISNYSGYGGLEKQGSFSDEELKGLLYEYFTPDAIVKKMWALAYKYGFGTIENPHVMEPSVGTGNFFKYAPINAELFGNEINRFSKKICEILYPKAMITLQPFEKNFISKNNSIKNKLSDIHKYHLVIGNPPYGRAYSKFLGMGEKDYTKASNFTEYFITRGLDLLHPGGLLIFVVGAEQYNGGTLFLDSGISTVKKNIFDKAQLVDAYRLPTKIFERTGVASEILVFKKK